MRIGILGGTFNPVHMGHLVLAQDALEEYELDKVLFVPCATPAHKEASSLAPARHRVAMLELALEHDPRFEVSMVELDRGGVSYTIDTVEALSVVDPTAELFFIIGGDTLFEIHSWRQVERLLSLCEFIVMARPGFEDRELTAQALRLDDPWPERLAARVTAMHQVEVSSSDIRMRVAEGLSIRYLVPPEVAMYICEHNLYNR
jgi:nicotinate-nucleotide adenylyltransferase